MPVAIPHPGRPRLLGVVLAACLVAGLLAAPMIQSSTSAQTCPPGTYAASEVRDSVAPDQAANLPAQYRGFQDIDPPDVLGKVACVSDNAPEAFQDMALRDRQWNAARTAPFASVAEGANSAAAAQRQQMLAEPADVPGADGTFLQYGAGPLIFDDPRFNEGQIAQLGLVDSTGRIDDLKFDEPTGQLFAAIGTGGIWRSMDLGDSWEPISDSLPAAVVGAVAYSSAGGEQGTILTVTGEHTFGGNAYTGIGAYYSRDGGATWQKSAGVPDGALGFAIEVDPNDPNIVYAATQDGLFRSTDAGVNYTNVNLPTSPEDDDPTTPECTGVTRSENNDECNFANSVTDVTLKAPGGVGEPGTRVIAAVGWRAGMMRNPDPDGSGPERGSIQSPSNGVYGSETGEPDTFERLPGLDGPVGGRDNLGRIEFGPTIGPEQDHDFLYAIIEDAVLFNGGVPGIDAGDPVGAPNLPNSLNGIYVSDDFGTSWTQVESDNEISQGCAATGSALCIPGLIQPGVQAWYDLWIAPDPSVQDGAVPSRVVFGIEEIWQNVRGVPAENIGVEEAVDGPETAFEVFGRYFSGDTCAFGLIPVPGEACPTSRPPAGTTTTHPDQHAGIFVPNGSGDGVSLLVGHDGGFSRQDVGAPAGQQEFNNGDWQLEQNNGLQTLLSYSAVIANDGVAWAGLQDNGHMKIEPEPGNDSAQPFAQFETFGGDGTFAAVEADNSDVAYESVQGGLMHVTTDGGRTWRFMASQVSGKRFVNPFVLDPTDVSHLATGGFSIVESTFGTETAIYDPTETVVLENDWVEVFDLGFARGFDGEESTVSNQMSALDVRGDAIYAGFCGTCDLLNARVPFNSGIATNIGGDQPPERLTENGWHIATAEGLPNRFVTSVAVDPEDASNRTIYVTLGGYSRRWVPPGSVDDPNADIGEGHVFKSIDAGETFTDISGNLPDIPAAWIEPRGDQLIVGTDNGVYISSDTEGGPYAVLGGDQLPAVPVTSLQLKADDPNFLLVGTYGRSLFSYTFPTEGGGGEEPTDPPTDPPTTPPATPPGTPADIRRVAGEDRILTAIETSQQLFADDSADAVVLARGDDYADALAGAPFTRSVDAPMLITHRDDLTDQVAAEIERLGAETAYLLGGEEALEPQVAAELTAAGLTVERRGGDNRFDTARVLAEEIGGTDVYVTEGFDVDPKRGWPDALAIAPLAAKQERPILLVDTNGVPQETAEAIEALDVANATVVGGEVAVSGQTEEDIRALGVNTTRLAGETRFGTSALASVLAEDAGLSFQRLWLARGGDWPDALTSGPTVAADNGILLLVDDADLDNSPQTRDIIEDRGCEVSLLRFLGGTEAISANTENQVRGFLEPCAAS